MKLNIQSPAKKLRTQYEFCVMDVDAKHRGEGGGSRGVGSNRTPADNGGGASKIDKILRTSFMDGPLESFGFS